MITEICFPPKRNCRKILYRQPPRKVTDIGNGPLRPEAGPTDPQPWRVFTPREILKINEHLKDWIEQEVIDEITLADIVYIGMINSMMPHVSTGMKEKLQKLILSSVKNINAQKKFSIKLHDDIPDEILTN